MRRLIALFAALAAAASASAQLSSFTYQGELQNDGTLANGPHDFRFVLFDVPSGGSAVTPVRCAEGVPVQNGRFTVDLDFGGLDFQNLWLEIQVRPATGLGCPNGLGLTTLSPRQRLSPTPFSMVTGFAMNSQTLGGAGPNFYRQASNLLGALPSASLSGTYTQPMTLNNSGNIFAGNGSGLTALSASSLTLGTIPDARLSSTVALLNRTNTFQNLATFTAGASFSGVSTFNAGVTFTAPTTFSAAATFNGGIALPATTRAFSIPAHAFHPAASVTSTVADSNALRGTSVGQAVAVDAAVHLPDGALITQFDAYVTDNDAVQLIGVNLIRFPIAGTGFQTLATTTTTAAGASPSLQSLTDTSLQNATVDNDAFAYYIRAVWTVPATPTTITLRGAKITYTITTPLP